MSRRSSEQKKQSTVIKRILRRTFGGESSKDEKKYAEKQLKKIYSQEFSKLMNQKKYEVLFQKNKSEIDCHLSQQASSRIKTINKMQQKSSERRSKILSDRLKIYQNNDKKWSYKTQQIKQRFITEDKQMLKNAQEYRNNWQKSIKQRQYENDLKLKIHSKRNYTLFNSSISSPIKNQYFNQKKLKELMKKRQNKFGNMRKTKSIENDILMHQKREQFLFQSKEKNGYEKLYNKLEKMNSIEIKRNKVKTQSIQRAKKNLNYRENFTPKSEVGEICPKFQENQENQEKTRMKTLQNMSYSRLGQSYLQYSTLRASQSAHHDFNTKNEKSLIQYNQKIRKLKLNKLLKATVRNQLTNQYKKEHSKSNYIS